MSIALVAHGEFSSTDTNGFTSTSLDTSGANLLVVGMAHNTGTTPTLSDSKGNSWTKIATKDSGSGAASSLFYAAAAIVGTGHTFTCVGSGSFPSMFVAALSGALAASPFDQTTNSQVLGGSTLATGSVTPTEANEVIVTVAASNASVSAINGGFTITGTKPTVGGAAFGGGAAYLVQGSAAAANPTWTLGGTDNATSIIATFKATPDVGRMFAMF